MTDIDSYWKQYPLNLDGINPANLITDEMTPLAVNYPVIRMDYAPFYEEGLVVRDFYGKVLTPGTHYDIVRTTLDVDKTLRSGKPVYHSIQLYDVVANTNLFVTYYCYGGGELSSSRVPYHAIQRINEELATEDWDNILNKDTRFPTHTSTHWGHSSELTSCGVVVEALNELNAAMQAYWAKYHADATTQRIAPSLQSLHDNIRFTMRKLQSHAIATGNVHRVTPPDYVTATSLAAHLDALTAEVDQLINTNDEVAVALDVMALDAQRWEGLTLPQVIETLRRDIPAGAITLAAFTPDQLGPHPGGQCFMSSEGRWISVETLQRKEHWEAVNNVKGLGAKAPDGIAETLKANEGVAVGTVITFQYRIPGHGLGLYRAKRTVDGWRRIG